MAGVVVAGGVSPSGEAEIQGCEEHLLSRLEGEIGEGRMDYP